MRETVGVAEGCVQDLEGLGSAVQEALRVRVTECVPEKRAVADRLREGEAEGDRLVLRLPLPVRVSVGLREVEQEDVVLSGRETERVLVLESDADGEVLNVSESDTDSRRV